MKTTVDYQSGLSQLLKRKAVGPNGSRHLNKEDLDVLTPALKSEEVSLVSKAVLVTAVIILERNKLEKQLLDQWRSGRQFLPDELRRLFFGESESEFEYILHKILKGEDLTAEKARRSITCLLDSAIPDYQKGILLIGERLKRESFVENEAFLHGMREAIDHNQAEVSLLIDLADPYDGFRRYPIYTPFVASLLAAMGIPAYCHGLQRVAPKNGDTIHKILELAGKNPLKSVSSVIGDIENNAIGWGYVDQSVYFPELYALRRLRDDIVKRPFLATLEKLLQPLRSKEKNFMVAGYVHTHYKQELARLLENKSFLDGVFIVKGMEGATQLDFRKNSDDIVVRNGKRFTGKIEGQKIPYPEEEWEQCESLAEYTLETGLRALNGKKNIAREILINQGVQIAGRLGIVEPAGIHKKVTNVLDSGRVLKHWQNGCI